MSNSLAVGNFGYSPTAYQYFMNAYNSPNVNHNQFANQANYNISQAQNPVLDLQTPSVETTGSNVQFKGNSQKEKNNGAAWGIIGTVAVIGAAALCRKAYKAGNVNTTGLKKIASGFKKYWRSSIDKVKNIIPRPTVTKVGNKTVCTIPNRTNIIEGDDIINLSEKVGVSTKSPKLAENLANIKEFSFKYNEYNVTMNEGNIIKLEYDGKNLLDRLNDNIVFKNNILNKGSSLLKKDKLGELSNITFIDNIGNSRRTFFAKSGNSNLILKRVETPNFTLDSDVVRAYRITNPSFDEVVKNFGKGKTDNLRIVTADVKQNFGTVKLKGKGVEGIQVGETFYENGSDRFIILQNQYQKLFDRISKGEVKLSNIVYAC